MKEKREKERERDRETETDRQTDIEELEGVRDEHFQTFLSYFPK